MCHICRSVSGAPELNRSLTARGAGIQMIRLVERNGPGWNHDLRGPEIQLAAQPEPALCTANSGTFGAVIHRHHPFRAAKVNDVVPAVCPQFQNRGSEERSCRGPVTVATASWLNEPVLPGFSLHGEELPRPQDPGSPGSRQCRTSGEAQTLIDGGADTYPPRTPAVPSRSMPWTVTNGASPPK